MLDPIDTINVKSCRICLTNKTPLRPLFRYQLSGNYAEMLTVIADVKVSSNDGFPEKICLKCCTTLEKAFLLKTMAERSDKKLRKILAREKPVFLWTKEIVPTKKIAFNSSTDIKSKNDLLAIPHQKKPVETMEGKDMVKIKVDPNAGNEPKIVTDDSDEELTWESIMTEYNVKNDPNAEYLDDDVFQDDNDDDYVPPVEKAKTKFKKPKLSDIKVFKEKTIVRKVKVVKKIGEKKEYTCFQCSRSFAQKSNLTIHVKQHTGIKDHICEKCGAGLYSYKSLTRHLLIHKKERPFSCNICSKRFIARYDLHRHLRIHWGYKPYECNICSEWFNAKHQLQHHERKHTGEKPFTCQVCNVAFSYKVNLNNHVIKVHDINLKFKSIHTVTEDVLRELGMSSETRVTISHIMPQLGEVPTPAAHETVLSLT